ncbi:MAG: hypothetical protein JSS32_09090 [Verrucomicrobia bacterium]|nr:hypothetical protein [Verrucomicrobiota bacterium]
MTEHAEVSLGARMALVNQIKYVEAITGSKDQMGLIQVVTFFLMTLLSNNLIAIQQAMTDQLNQDTQNQTNFTNEWAGDSADDGYPVDPNDPNDHDHISATMAWLTKYLADAEKFSGQTWGTDPFSALFFDAWWKDNDQSPHKNIGSWLDNFHEKYVTDQLDGQNKTSAAQKPVNQWNQSISDFNKTTVSDYEQMKSFNSIFQNLNAKTSK